MINQQLFFFCESSSGRPLPLPLLLPLLLLLLVVVLLHFSLSTQHKNNDNNKNRRRVVSNSVVLCLIDTLLPGQVCLLESVHHEEQILTIMFIVHLIKQKSSSFIIYHILFVKTFMRECTNNLCLSLLTRFLIVSLAL